MVSLSCEWLVGAGLQFFISTASSRARTAASLQVLASESQLGTASSDGRRSSASGGDNLQKYVQPFS